MGEGLNLSTMETMEMRLFLEPPFPYAVHVRAVKMVGNAGKTIEICRRRSPLPVLRIVE